MVIRRGFAEIKNNRLSAAKEAITYLAIGLAALAAFGSYKNSIEIKHVSHDSIQRQCEMAFANGKAIIKTASRDERPSPDTIEAYRKNIESEANQVLNKYDIDFHCDIPPIGEDGK